MAKKRVTIYIDEDDWKSIRMAALDLGISASRYLADLHMDAWAKSVGLPEAIKEVLDEEGLKELPDEDINEIAEAVTGTRKISDEIISESEKSGAMKKSVDNIEVQDPSKAGYFKPHPKKGKK